ncbi:outer membrane lipoprotein-sorting protein [Desulfonauticus submarinus]
MKKSVCCVVCFFIWASIGWAITGKEIIEKQKQKHKVKTEVATEVMLLVDSDGSKEKRLVKRYAKEVEPDLHRYLIVFTAPADIKGTALLTWENKDRANDQWLYMPAIKKMQRIAKGSKKNYFMGTDFTYEDMEPEDIDNYNYTILREEILTQDKKDWPCYVIEAVPATKQKKRESSYGKRIMWITKNDLLTLKIEFYNKRGKLIKVQTNHGFKEVQSGIFRPAKTLMNNIERKHKTLTGTKTRSVNVDLDNSVFTERYILTGKYLQ